MGRKQFTRVSPSGATLNVSWDGQDTVSFAAGVNFVGGSYGRAFQVSPAGAHDFAAANLLDATLVSRLQVNGHEVRISTSRDQSTTIASLIGKYHELMTVFAGPAPAASMISELFAVLDIKDKKDGMQVSPQRSTGLTVGGEHIYLEHSDNTTVDAPAPAFARDMIPKKAGKKTKHGEVWRSQLPDRPGNSAKDYSYVVGTPGGVAEVQFGQDSTLTDEQVLAIVDSVDISWS